MRTFDDLLEYEIGEEVQLFNAPTHVNGKYQYTLVEASSEKMAIRKCM